MMMKTTNPKSSTGICDKETEAFFVDSFMHRNFGKPEEIEFDLNATDHLRHGQPSEQFFDGGHGVNCQWQL